LPRSGKRVHTKIDESFERHLLLHEATHVNNEDRHTDIPQRVMQLSAYFAGGVIVN
jgi:hypothetical protein